MNFDKPKNENYAAVVARVPAVVPIIGRDRIVMIPIFGHTAIVQKGWNVGDLGVFFPAEVQLSHEYASANNMYRHAENNADGTVTGYLEDNRRVKAIKLGGQRSNAIFMPLSSLEVFGIDPADLREGDTFDTINGQEVCRKYVIREPKTATGNQPVTKRPGRVDPRMFPEHLSTASYFRNADQINDADYVYVTQKLHGTSIRVGRTLVNRKLTIRERLARRMGVRVQTTEYDQVYGSRRVTKDANDPNQRHFYKSDIWTQKGRELDGLIPDGFLVFGELVGWTPDGEPIQKGYTYQIPKGQSRLYVYRVATINDQGLTVDLSWPAVREFCAERGLEVVPTLYEGYAMDLDVNDLMDIRYRDAGWRTAVPLDENGTVDEGVVIRREGITPLLLKAKSPAFLEHETKMLDAGTVDLESAVA
ncbi:RNA ligase [Nocardia farcinica]|uniref:RNA ligase n=2 Tax=Nocardia farcinica TaxID=37329 RepID=A0A0H5NVI6_NOCFR|nr:RNA ligase family protein [Nocardia farcinica]AXK86545.1 hypothetical protein DXT66_13745 [Nocardia farcinica]PFW99048.1 hypothetical protein CJ469_05648 [Nocardia farcinica]PFX06086.1 hypothetical protein CJ468_04946 [Nocardia farcinica]CRY79815.1 RNA ligase [Nocardia farcinica]SIT33619.1 RNA ligase [Nocardia farcinica]